MNPIYISEEARKVDVFVEKWTEKNLPYLFLIILTILIENPDLTYFEIADRLNYKNPKIEQNKLKDCFNDYKHLIEDAILKANPLIYQCRCRKTTLKSTLNRHILGSEEPSSAVIGLFNLTSEQIANLIREQAPDLPRVITTVQEVVAILKSK